MAATVLGVIAVAFLLARSITGPLLRLTAAARAMEEGELSEERISELAQTRGSDEVARLSRVFASMAQQVQARERRLRQQVMKLRIEIDEVKKARQVAEITETEYFRRLREHVRKIRQQEEKR
ncbi:MAG TPA: HAMP domain-containing protein [Chloroflexi bacterium]|nr:HAMP domain-containing protein [Chloroflexota bacterium]